MGNENYLAKKYLLFFTVPTEEIRPASTSRYRIVLVVDKPNPSEEAMSFALHCPLFSKKERIFFSLSPYLVSGLASEFSTESAFPLTLKHIF